MYKFQRPLGWSSCACLCGEALYWMDEQSYIFSIRGSLLWWSYLPTHTSVQRCHLSRLYSYGRQCTSTQIPCCWGASRKYKELARVFPWFKSYRKCMGCFGEMPGGTIVNSGEHQTTQTNAHWGTLTSRNVEYFGVRVWKDRYAYPLQLGKDISFTKRL